jgi:hypothetical protein
MFLTIVRSYGSNMNLMLMAKNALGFMEYCLGPAEVTFISTVHDHTYVSTSARVCVGGGEGGSPIIISHLSGKM